ncbi:MAG: alpha/beta hydrolase [Deltaproteobacteria bacterium]|nr:MAG: alpha/beta hydrolase [Deltaproteobacteria bacterium]
MTPEYPSDPSSQPLKLSKGTAAYTVEGEGQTVVAVHGLPGTVRDFRWLASSLGGNVRLYRLNLPGFGGTELSCAPGTSLQDRVDFVRECLDALAIDSCVVMGHSMGGPVSMGVTALEPERVKGLILLASVALRPHKGYRRQKPSFQFLSKLLRVPGVPLLMKKPITQAFAKGGFSSSLTYPELLRSLHYVAGVDFADVRAFASQVRVPTFMSWADDDTFFEAVIQEELAEASQAGPRLRFDVGGHNIQKSQAIELSEAILPWLKTLSW